MSRHNVTDPDAFVDCPFNDAHQVPASRLQRHIMKCEKQHAHLDLRHCPFNYCHLKPPSELRDHMMNCPDKALVERCIPGQADSKPDENRKMGHFTEITWKDDWADDDSEDWDKEDATPETPVAPTAFDRAQQNARMPRTMPKAMQHLVQPSFMPSSQRLPHTSLGRGRGLLYQTTVQKSTTSISNTSSNFHNDHRDRNGDSVQPKITNGSINDSLHNQPGTDQISTRFLGRGRGLLVSTSPSSSCQSDVPRVGKASSFDSDAQSLLVTAGRGRGRGRGLLAAKDSPEERKRRELHKWTKKKREVEELESRHMNGINLSRDERDKLARKEHILEQFERLSLLSGCS